jgi:hypothetical protein
MYSVTYLAGCVNPAHEGMGDFASPALWRQGRIEHD